MDSRIEQLLEKYWNCETSLEEEQQLREYFSGEGIPPQWKETSDLFRYFGNQKAQRMTGDAFDREILEKVKDSKPSARIVTLFSSYGRIAAGLLVMVAAAYFIRQEVRKSYPADVADTYSDPKLAFEETKKALMMISKGFGKAQKETTKINMFNEAERKIGGKKDEEKKDKTSI